MKLSKKQRGQVAVFYALLIPIVFVLGSMGLELGWYYLNVSRLQNAADAAVLVGAKALVEQEKIGGVDNPVYGYKVKLVEKYPASEPSSDFSADIAHDAALAYAKKNLADNSVGYTTPSLFSVAEAYEANATFNDSYARGGDPKVNFNSSLYKNGDSYYYVVGMNEDVHHFFIGYLDDMGAGVVAVALISKTGEEPAGGDDHPALPGKVKLVFNANGKDATFNDKGNLLKTIEKEFDSPSQMADDEFSEHITPGIKPENPGYVFKGWSTDPNPDKGKIIDYIRDGQQISKEEMQALCGSATQVNLYAVWVEEESTSVAKPHNSKTLWEQMQYLIAKNVYHYNWTTCTVTYGGDPINNRFNYFMAYNGDGTKGKIYREGYYTTTHVDALTEYRETGEVPGGWTKFNGDVTWPREKNAEAAYSWETNMVSFTSNGIKYRWVKTDKSSDSKKTIYYDTQVSGSSWKEAKNNNSVPKLTKGGNNGRKDGSYARSEWGYYERWVDGYKTYEEVIVTPAHDETVWHEGEDYEVTYPSGKHIYATETIDLGSSKSDGNKPYNRNDIATSTHYFLDFWQEGTSGEYMNYNGGKINSNTANSEQTLRQKSVTSERKDPSHAKPSSTADDLFRIHSLFNVNTTYAVRTKKDDNGNTTYPYGDDPLYCRIEAEPYESEYTAIRQIVININKDNTATGLRPLFIYYDGPDARGEKTNNVTPGDLKAEKAQPVILNLNADFKGVLFMPNIPVVINGNGKKFEGFIIAKEYRYLDTTHGKQVNYSIDGKRDKTYYNNPIRVDNHGNVISIRVDKDTASDLWSVNSRSTFYLSSDSHFKKFNIDLEVNYAYIKYDFETLILDKTPFYDDRTGKLIDISDAVGNRVSEWNDVIIYGKNVSTGDLVQIPKQISNNSDLENIKKLVNSAQRSKLTSADKARGIVLLDENNEPIKIYDAMGNEIYFCADYMRMVGNYTVFTLDKMDDTTDTTAQGMRSRKEFLLTKTATSNVSNTDDWT